jgi:hypothetical protein
MGPGKDEQGFSEQTSDISSGNDTGYADQTYDTARYDVPSDSGYDNRMPYESDSGGVCYEPGTEPGEPNASYLPGTEPGEPNASYLPGTEPREPNASYEPGSEPGEPNACYDPGSDSEPTQAKESKQFTVMYRLQNQFFPGSAIFCACEHLSSGKEKEKLLVTIRKGEKPPKGIKVVYETSSCEKEVTREDLSDNPCPHSANVCQ